jgi:hypothetical protein
MALTYKYHEAQGFTKVIAGQDFPGKVFKTTDEAGNVVKTNTGFFTFTIVKPD